MKLKNIKYYSIAMLAMFNISCNDFLEITPPHLLFRKTITSQKTKFKPLPMIFMAICHHTVTATTVTAHLMTTTTLIIKPEHGPMGSMQKVNGK